MVRSDASGLESTRPQERWRESVLKLGDQFALDESQELFRASRSREVRCCGGSQVTRSERFATPRGCPTPSHGRSLHHGGDPDTPVGEDEQWTVHGDEVALFSPQAKGVAVWTDGRARALTVVTPVRRGTFWLQWIIYRFERRNVRKIHHRTTAMGLVYEFNWSLVRRNPKLGIDRPHLLFQSNFVGDWDDYIDVFVAVHKVGLLLHFLSAKGFPSLGQVPLVRDYIRVRDREPLRYHCAYPSATPRDLQQLAERFVAAPGAPDPRWISCLLPIPDTDVLNAIRSERGLLDLPGVHFGRIVSVPFNGPPVLLVSVAIDPSAGSDAVVLQNLVALRPGLWNSITDADRTGEEDSVAILLRGRVRDTDGLSYFSAGGLDQATIAERIESLWERA